MLCAARSERLLMAQLDYDFLFRSVCGTQHRRSGLGRDGLRDESGAFAGRRGCTGAFSAAVVEQAGARGLLSDGRFTVDGTLIEAVGPEHKSSQRKGDDRPPRPTSPASERELSW